MFKMLWPTWPNTLLKGIFESSADKVHRLMKPGIEHWEALISTAKQAAYATHVPIGLQLHIDSLKAKEDLAMKSFNTLEEAMNDCMQSNVGAPMFTTAKQVCTLANNEYILPQFEGMVEVFKRPTEADEIYYDNDKGIFTSKPKTYHDSLAGWYLEQCDKEEAAKQSLAKPEVVGYGGPTSAPLQPTQGIDSSNQSPKDPGPGGYKYFYENSPEDYRVYDSRGQSTRHSVGESVIKDKFAFRSSLATRHNAGKVELSYLFDCPLANEAKCRAAMFGAQKYGQHNWRKGLPVSNFMNSTMRHLTAYVNGEILDPESGIHHLGHVLWNVEKAMEFSLTKPELDDRFKPDIKE